jgi:hypothetical protein
VSSAPERAAEACLERIERTRRRLAAPTFPLGIERAELLARAKGEPVVFTRVPRQASGEKSAELEIWRTRIFGGKAPAFALYKQYGVLRQRPAIARDLLLREGYLYADTPGFGAAVVAVVELQHLFDAPELVIERGAAELRAVRDKEGYVYADGPEQGRAAHLLLFDRVRPADQAAADPLHRDLRKLQAELGFDRASIEQIGPAEAVARLRYGSHWVPALLTSSGARLSLGCQALAASTVAQVEATRALARRRARVLSELRRTVEQMIDEALPFDEPKTEEGQQDGNLRPKWRFAYLQGWERYEFNEDHYKVFDAAGRPRVPQVCVDFITDSLERASGTWWRPRGEPRERVQGALDFDELTIDNRRSVGRFVEFAERHPEWFDVYHLSSQERIPFDRRREFFEHLFTHADRYLPGDVVTIHGLRDDDEYHYHSFFVLESDPVTGMPTLVGANAGRPRMRPLGGEMLSAPKRSLKTRIRPRLEWLESILPEQDVSLLQVPGGRGA